MSIQPLVAHSCCQLALTGCTGDGSRRHLQGYAWAQESRWPHGKKDKASISHLDNDYFDVQGPFPAPAAAPASGVDASAAAAPALSGNRQTTCKHLRHIVHVVLIKTSLTRLQACSCIAASCFGSCNACTYHAMLYKMSCCR